MLEHLEHGAVRVGGAGTGLQQPPYSVTPDMLPCVERIGGPIRQAAAAGVEFIRPFEYGNGCLRFREWVQRNRLGRGVRGGKDRGLRALGAGDVPRPAELGARRNGPDAWSSAPDAR